jgi:hypothetical protein
VKTLEDIQSDRHEMSTAIRFSKIKGGYTWSITVAAENSSIESLRAAKDRAVAISAEFQAEFGPKAEVDEIPF